MTVRYSNQFWGNPGPEGTSILATEATNPLGPAGITSVPRHFRAGCQALRMLLSTPTIVSATFAVFFARTSPLFAQQLSDTSGWALRGNQTCTGGESECGPTANGFVACCPSSAPCLSQYNSVCCPPSKAPAPAPALLQSQSSSMSEGTLSAKSFRELV